MQTNRTSRIRRFARGTLFAGLLCGSATAQSVDPEKWARTDLLEVRDQTYHYDHFAECSMRDEAAKPDERVLTRVRATAPVGAMSRDQLVALIQRMEAVFQSGVGQGFRPSATAMEIFSIIDCRRRPGSQSAPQQELVLEIDDKGFRAEFLDHDKGSKIAHGETWPEAFRP